MGGVHAGRAWKGGLVFCGWRGWDGWGRAVVGVAAPGVAVGEVLLEVGGAVEDGSGDEDRGAFGVGRCRNEWDEE